MDPYGVQNEEICTRDPSGLAATSPQAGRSFWGRSQAKGGVVRILRGEEFLGEEYKSGGARGSGGGVGPSAGSGGGVGPSAGSG